MPDLKILINGTEVVVPEQTITEAVGKGELTIQNDDLKVFKKPDFESYVQNVKKEDYENGKVAGVEMQIKAAREKFGLQFEGKTIDNFADALTKKLKDEFGKEPDKKVQELTKDLETLRGINLDWENKYKNLEVTINSEKVKQKKDALIFSALPKDNLTIPVDDLAIIFKNKYEIDFDETDGKPLIKKDGQVLKNQTTLSPLSLTEIIPEFTKPYIKPKDGGRGDGHNTGGGAGKMDEFVKEMEAKGHKPGSLAFNQELQKRISEKTLTL